ncbi:MAG: helix-turn-helix domain-containing protein [Planctomyces sp.]
MPSTPPHPDSGSPLALRPKDAAKALGIGERTLWDLTHPRGPIPCVRTRGCVLYPYHLLQAWLAEQAGKAVDQ